MSLRNKIKVDHYQHHYFCAIFDWILGENTLWWLLLGTFGCSIIAHTLYLFQKHHTFNFGYQIWFLGIVIIIFIKLMLCNIISKTIINFIIYIEKFMGIFIVNKIRPLSHFDHPKFKVSLDIKIIKFNGIKNMAHLIMFVIFHVNVIICQKFNLPHIYCIFFWKNSFFEMKNFKLVTWYPNMV
jgi:hypothetical protein